MKVAIRSQVAHNHACGCTKCWKPQGAAFSVVAVAPTSAVEVLENGDKLAVVDPAAAIKRHACVACGVHMHGPVENPAHPFAGLSFIYPERLDEILVDVGTVDPFLESELTPERLEAACRAARIPLTLRRQAGYDHSYSFVATFMEGHLRWHAERLGLGSAS